MILPCPWVRRPVYMPISVYVPASSSWSLPRLLWFPSAGMPRPSPDLNFISTSVLRTGVCVPHLLLLRWHKRGAVRDKPHLNFNLLIPLVSTFLALIVGLSMVSYYLAGRPSKVTHGHTDEAVITNDGAPTSAPLSA